MNKMCFLRFSCFEKRQIMRKHTQKHASRMVSLKETWKILENLLKYVFHVFAKVDYCCRWTEACLYVQKFDNFVKFLDMIVKKSFKRQTWFLKRRERKVYP
jgi:hypothetical protein